MHDLLADDPRTSTLHVDRPDSSVRVSTVCQHVGDTTHFDHNNPFCPSRRKDRDSRGSTSTVIKEAVCSVCLLEPVSIWAISGAQWRCLGPLCWDLVYQKQAFMWFLHSIPVLPLISLLVLDETALRYQVRVKYTLVKDTLWCWLLFIKMFNRFIYITKPTLVNVSIFDKYCFVFVIILILLQYEVVDFPSISGFPGFLDTAWHFTGITHLND